MIRINDQSISRADALASICPMVQGFDGCLTAVGSKDPMVYLGAVLHAMSTGGSVLLLPSDTPPHTALMQAHTAGAHLLLTSGEPQAVPLKSERPRGEASLFQFTSGTTGTPKLIGRTWDSVRKEIVHYNAALESSQEETPIVLVPLSHSFGLITGVLAALERETDPIIITGQNPKLALGILKSTPRSIVYAVPFMLQLLFSLSKEKLAFHRVVASGAPLTQSLLESLKHSSVQLLQQYGSTETGALSIAFDPSATTDVGRPLKHVYLSVSKAGSEPGEVAALISGKWYRTHDCGYWDEHNRLHILGRADELINVSGYKVIPAEVEEVILTCPGIKEVVVYRSRHPVWGDAVKALIVTEDILMTPEAVKGWCADKLAPYKVPRHIEFTTEIPRNERGKISRTLLENKERA
jgi:3,4-dihydroxybenzoate---[aryl-carrier protein] ligase